MGERNDRNDLVVDDDRRASPGTDVILIEGIEPAVILIDIDNDSRFLVFDQLSQVPGCSKIKAELE